MTVADKPAVLPPVTVPDLPGETRPMSYEEYMATPEEMARYDILDGYKQYRLYGENQVPSPTFRHQRIVFNIGMAFHAFEKLGLGRVCLAPRDVLISRTPKLRTRQPDVLFISADRMQNYDITKADPLSPAPELVVEIVSPSDTASILAAKIADYQSVDVKELWDVRNGPQTVEVLVLSAHAAPVSAGIYAMGQTVQSVVFPGLRVAVADIFAA